MGYLRELVTYYGKNGLDDYFNSFNGPTSTSKNLAVAWRFASKNGMVMQLNNVYGRHHWESFFDVSGISAYPEEDERLFCGSSHRLQVQDVIDIGGKINYKSSLSALFKMDAALSGT